MARPYQIIVWGATGFTGQLVCEHIAAKYQGKIQWAMAGRNQGKLETVRSKLVAIDKMCKDVPIVVADSANQESVDTMVSQADMLIACAGPFSKYTAPVVDASVRLKTNYCDITGEVHWVRDNIKKYHDQAKENQVKIVHCCGFDSAPSDLGAFFIVNHIRKTMDRGCKKVEALVEDMSGSASGGTVATIMSILEEMTPELMKISQDPYSLDPPESRRGPDSADTLLPAYSKNANTWTAPFLMESCNTRVVRRSNALLGHSYGENCTISERLKTSSVFGAMGGTLFMISVGLISAVSFLKAIAMRYLPKPGEGPTKEQQLNGMFQYRFVAETEEKEGSPSSIVQAVLRCEGHDPGYWGTSLMVLECALCQVLEKERLKEESLADGGVLTPAAAFGMVAIDRLINAGFSFKIVE